MGGKTKIRVIQLCYNGVMPVPGGSKKWVLYSCSSSGIKSK